MKYYTYYGYFGFYESEESIPDKPEYKPVWVGKREFHIFDIFKPNKLAFLTRKQAIRRLAEILGCTVEEIPKIMPIHDVYMVPEVSDFVPADKDLWHALNRGVTINGIIEDYNLRGVQSMDDIKLVDPFRVALIDARLSDVERSDKELVKEIRRRGVKIPLMGFWYAIKRGAPGTKYYKVYETAQRILGEWERVSIRMENLQELLEKEENALAGF